MPEDIREFYNEQDETYYQTLCGLIYIELKKSESNTTPGLSEKGVLDALPESFQDSTSLVHLELEYMVKDGLVSVTDEIYRVVAGKTPPHWTGLD
jgi:hypothetical protein